jgi:hypothetical protein
LAEATVPIILDHIAVFAPTLQAGLDHVRASLGVEPGPGGQHPAMGTHNRLLRLGADLFLEVIAIDPSLPAPTGHRPWFELGDTAATGAHWTAGRRLRGMVARTHEVDAVVAMVPELGAPMRVTRGTRQWRFAIRGDGMLPAKGALPHVMDWEAQGPAGPTLPDQGCRLVDLVLETPEPLDAIARQFHRLGFERAPRLTAGAATRLIAAIETPSGVRILT